MHPELRGIVEDFERLWTVAGFAEQFAANPVLPPAPAVPGDPYDLVLAEHHRRLVGFYLSRRLSRGRLDDWRSPRSRQSSIRKSSM